MADSQSNVEDRDLQLPALQTWTQAQRNYWERYVCDLADRLHLRDIELYFEWGKSLERHDSARAIIQLKRNRLRMVLGENLPNESAEEARDTAVHELVHYHTARLRDAIMRVEDHVHKDVFLTLARMIDLDEEQLVDMLTRLLAPTMPLPEWPVTTGRLPERARPARRSA